MINRHSELSITRQAELLGFSRGMVYYTPKAISDDELILMHAIDKLHMDFPFMGARMLRNQLNRQGFQVGRRHVQTLMRRMGIHAIYRKPKNTSANNPEHRVYPYLLHGMNIAANQVWALDTTYIPMARGFVYLTAVIDWATDLRSAERPGDGNAAAGGAGGCQRCPGLGAAARPGRAAGRLCQLAGQH